MRPSLNNLIFLQHPEICESLKDSQRNTILKNLGGEISRDVVLFRFSEDYKIGL
jgi:hypothetical protein